MHIFTHRRRNQKLFFTFFGKITMTQVSAVHRPLHPDGVAVHCGHDPGDRAHLLAHPQIQLLLQGEHHTFIAVKYYYDILLEL